MWQTSSPLDEVEQNHLLRLLQEWARRAEPPAAMFATNRAMIELAQEIRIAHHLNPQDPPLMRASRSLYPGNCG